MIKLMAVCFLGFVFVFSPVLSFAQKVKSPPVTKADSPKAKHADTNADGVVTKKEAQVEKKKDDSIVNKAWEKQADVNQDGLVDNKELDLWQENDPLKWKIEADENFDGVVDDKELMLWKTKHPEEE